jgi:hypothetical protein
MRTNGRISAAQAASVRAMPLHRPDPPEELTPGQAAEWRAVVARMPANWFMAETQAALMQHCRQVERLHFIAEQLDHLQSAGEANGHEYYRLVSLEIQGTKLLTQLDAKMRLLQQTTQAKALSSRPVEIEKPWD